ncbi:glyoxalase [Aliifodinibius salipaludis]|uniref:Glyoxalase n=1 Tax=Fodinibius salipaludis TaxID=2032627 RepID=A0A2A2G7Z4_9BACT|nr:VOC family protein [Aliifodinibius salipaludis]PAU93270.1 glyoxalase [Aliifodinibius salipaludis]
MKLQSLTPNLMVEDVNRTIEFYTETLDFELLETVPEEGVLEWAFVRKDNVSLMFQKEESIRDEYPDLKDQKRGGALTLYIKVEDLKSLYQEIKDEVNLTKEMHKTFYGANEFAIKDPNSFILTFSDVLE